MKSYPTILAAMLAASLLLTGCSGPQNETSSAGTSSSVSSSEPDSSAQIPNPVQPVKTAAELAELGFDIVLPAEAEEIEYSVIGEELAQATFTLSGSEWTLRTGKQQEELSGLFGERTQLDPVEATAHDGTPVTIRIESVDSGEETPWLCASWELNGLGYTLAAQAGDETAFRETCSSIMSNLGGGSPVGTEDSGSEQTDSSSPEAVQ